MKLARYKVFAVTFTACIAILGVSRAFAFGLGEITLHSGLNEPLEATIELVQLDGLNESQVRVGMASAQNFERVDMQLTPFLTDIDFELEFTGTDTGVLHLSSEDPVLEPYLSFLLDARWPSGRMMREYTVLVDLPAFSGGRAEQSQAPETSPGETPESRVETDAAAPDSESAESTSSEAVAGQESEAGTAGQAQEGDIASAGDASIADMAQIDDPEREYAVEQNDTLWDIALQTRPDDAVSVQQMMLAIQRENRDAFMEDNINRLKAGQVLRIPPMESISAIGRQEAVDEVAVQNRRFSGLDSQPLAAGGGEAGISTEEGDELSVLTGDEAAQGNGGGNDLEATIADLEMQLMMSEENLDRALLENRELNSRLGDLNSQIELLDNIIDIEDERLAELQADLAAQAEAEAEAAAEQARQQQAQPDEQSQTAATESAPASTPAEAPRGMSARLSQMLQNPLMMLGVLGLLVILVLGLLVIRRKRAEEQEEEEFGFDFEEGTAPFSNDAAEDEVAETEADESQEDRNSGVLSRLSALMSGFPGRSRKDDELEEDESLHDAIESGFDEPEAEESSWASETGEDDDTQRFSADTGSTDESVPDWLEQSPEEESLSGQAVADEIEEPAPEAPEPVEGTEDAFEIEIEEEDIPVDEQTEDSEPPATAEADDDDGFDELIAEADKLTGFDAENEDAQAGEESTAEGEQEDEGFVEFNLATAADEAATDTDDKASDNHGPEEDEMFDFNLDDALLAAETQGEEEGAGESSASDDSQEEELETFEFNVAPREEEAPDESSDSPDLSAGVELADTGESPAEDSEAVQEEVAGHDADEDEDDIFDLGNLSFDENDLDDDADELAEDESESDDNSGSRIDLAVAYEAMGDTEGAREILQSVIEEGDEADQAEARKLLEEWRDSE